jgi:hypothetical protein
MDVVTAVGEVPPKRSECWCCGQAEQPERMVRLGNHPEVTLCVRCAHFVHKQAAEIEDLARTGWAVRGRDALRRARRNVVSHGWHHNPVVGPVLRRLGKHLP